MMDKAMRRMQFLVYKQVDIKSEARHENTTWLLLKNIEEVEIPWGLSRTTYKEWQPLRVSGGVFKEPEADSCWYPHESRRWLEYFSIQIFHQCGQVGDVLQRKEKLPKGHLSAFGRDLSEARDPSEWGLVAKQFWPGATPPRTMVVLRDTPSSSGLAKLRTCLPPGGPGAGGAGFPAQQAAVWL